VFAEGAGDTGIASAVSVNAYGPAPKVGVWAQYKIPLKSFMTNSKLGLETAMYKFGLQDQTGRSTNTFYVDNVFFTP
jgi:hypothetical protein